MADLKEEALALHRQLKGKVSIEPKTKLDKESLRLLYTPGVGAVSRHLAEHPEDSRELTMTSNTVAVVSDGSAVLGLGNVGPTAALPVMEGKALLFKTLAGVDAVPIVLDTQNTEDIIAAVKAIAPSYGGINLEDIAAPRCFEIERRLQAELPIPVMHDDQHATAIVCLAGLINACKITNRNLHQAKIVITGAGAAGSALVRMLHHYGVEELLLFDSKGLVSSARGNLDEEKAKLIAFTSAGDATTSRADALKAADIFIGLSVPGSVEKQEIASMAERSIVFALANPDPEIEPDEAKDAGAAVIATGRSDYPNQINNVLVFPGFFRGALDAQVRDITMEMKINAAEAIANLVGKPTAEEIIPSVFNPQVAESVAAAVRQAE